MSNRIDQRIVEMSFENAKFEKGILQSEKSLKNFSNALSIFGNGADFKGIEQSLATITNSFTTMGQIGTGALRRIGEAAVNAGISMFKSLAIAPITQGFGEMELKMNSTQTIMASTGETLETVNKHLQALNEYSDQTIYSFSDMTENIGKFTNAGVKLETAVSAIKGISNAAALSGANANEASRAMYNFSQALSAGYVKLLDWKSIELANMATVEFKTELLEAAVAAGTVKKEANGMYQVLTEDGTGRKMGGPISATKDFNDSLTNQWLTTKVLTSTLEKYSDATTDLGKRATLAATQVTTFSKLLDTIRESVGSGWSQTFEILFGDFNEARALWTSMNFSIGNTVAKMADARNALLSGGMSSGWKQFMQAGISNTEDFGATLTRVARESGIDLAGLVQKSGSMENALKGNWLTGEMLSKTVDKMAFSIGKMSDEQLANAGYSERTRNELLSLQKALASGALSAADFAKRMSGLSGRENVIQGLKNSVIALLNAVRPISKAFDQFFPPLTAKKLYDLTDNFKVLTQRLILSEENANKLQRTFAGLFAIVDLGWTTTKVLANALWEVVKIFVPLSGGMLSTTATAGDFLVMLNQIIKRSGVFEYALLGVKIAAIIVKTTIGATIQTIGNFIELLLSAEHPIQFLGETMAAVFTNIFKTFDTGFRWMGSSFFNSLDSIQQFFSNKLNLGDGTVISGVLKSLKDFLTYINLGGADGLSTISKGLDNLDFSRIATFVTGGILLVFINQLTRLTKVTGDLVESANTFTTKLTKKIFGPITKFKDLAFAVGVLSASLFVLANVPFEKMKVGLIGLGGAMVIFATSFALMQAITVIGSKKLAGAEPMAAALNLTAMAGGLAILAIAVAKISSINPKTVWNSVAVVGAMMGVIVAYQALTVAISLIPGTRAANIGMGMMASGLLGLIAIITIMDHIKPEVISSSLAKLTGAMMMLAGIQALFAFAARASGGSKVAVNIFGIAGGVLAMIGVIKLIGLVKPDEIAVGAKNVFLLGGVLAGLQAMFNLSGLISGGTAFKTNILSMQFGIASMIVLTKIAGSIDQATVQNGIKNVFKMAAIIGALEIVTGLAARIGGNNKLQKILGSISLSMVALTGIIAVIGNFEQSTIDRGFVSILKLTGLIMAIEAITAVIGTIKGSTAGVGVLVGMTLTILTLTASLALLAMIDQEALSKAATSLSKAIVAVGIMGAGLSLMISAFSKMTSGFSMLKGIVSTIIPGFIVAVTLLGALTVFLNVLDLCAPILNNVSWDVMLKFAAGMGAMVVFIGAFTLLEKIPGIKSGFKNLLSLIPGFAAVIALVTVTTAMFGIIGSVLPTIDKLSWESFSKIIVGIGFIGLLVAGFAKLSPLLAIAPATIGPALVGIAAALAAMGIVVLGVTGLAFLMQAIVGSYGDTLLSGIDKLILVAGAIGRFVGAIVGGFSSQVLIGFGDGIAKFSATMGQIDPNAFDGISSLAGAMLALTGAALVAGIARFIGLGTNPGELFGKQITGLITAFKHINPAEVTGFSAIIKVLAPSMDNLKKLIDAVSRIPNTGGFLGGLIGNNDADVFGTKIRGLITAFNGLSIADATKTGNLFKALAPAMNSFTLLTKAASTIPNTGGFIGGLMGNNDIDVFGTKVRGMILTFSSVPYPNIKAATTNMNALSPMLNVFGSLIKVANTIPNSGGLASLFAGNNDIDKFGDKIRKLILSFSVLDVSKLNTAKNNISSLSGVIADMLRMSVASIDDRKSDVISSFTKMFDLMVKNANKYIGEFTIVGYNIVQGLQKGITNGQKDAVKAADKMAAEVIKSAKTRLEVNSPSKVFDEIGTWLPVGLGNGIKKNSKVAILASANMGGAVEDSIRNTLGVHSESEIFNNIGSWIPTSISNGIESAKEALLQTAKDVGLDTSKLTLSGINTGLTGGEYTITSGINTLLDLLTGKTSITAAATKMGVSTGSKVADGIASGIDKDDTKVKKAAAKAGKDAFEIMKASIDARKEYNLITIDEEIQAWADFASLYAKGSEMRLKADKELGKVRFEWSKKWMDQEKYYKRLSLEQELRNWENVRDRYEKYSEYRLEAEREVFRLKEEIWQAEYQHELKVIDDAKYYGKLKLDEELNALKKIRDMTMEHSDEREKTDREIFRVEKEINEANLSYESQLKQLEKDRSDARMKAADDYYQKERDINEQLTRDIASLRAAYDDAVESRAKTLYSTYGLFDKVDEQKAVKGSDLIANLEDQNKAFDVWQKNINTLTAKGIDDGLIKELREMGPKATSQIIALNSMSDSELTKYVALWREKSADAKAQATLELQSMKQTTEAKIVELTTAANEKLAGYKKVWEDTLKDIDANSKTQLLAIQTEWSSSIGTMSTTGIGLIKQFKHDWFGEMDSIVNTTRSKLSDLATLMADSNRAVPSISAAIKSVVSGVDTSDIGKEAANGIAAGLKNNKQVVEKPAARIAGTVYKTMKDSLEIQSPSKKTMELGMFVVMGLAKGIIDFTNLATSAASGLGAKAASALSTGMEDIPYLLDTETDLTITPVVDLSKVKSGVDDMNQMFARAKGLDVSTTLGLLPSVSSPQKGTADQKTTANDTSGSNQTFSFVQNNYSPTPLSRLDIYRQTQKQISSFKRMV